VDIGKYSKISDFIFSDQVEKEDFE